MYDYLIVDAGLYEAVCARELTDDSNKVFVIERRSHIAGNVYTKQIEGINVHKFGAHIFHTTTRRSGITPSVSPLSTVSRTVSWQTIRVNVTLYPSICTHSTRCGE